jgi:hypothetical protein
LPPGIAERAGIGAGPQIALRATMRTLRLGAVLLTLWCGLNLLVAAVVTVLTIVRRTPILAMLFSDGERALDPKLVNVIYAQAALANPTIVALCVLVLVIVWRALMTRHRWAFWTLVATLGPLQAFGFVSDGYLGNRNLVANMASTGLLAIGLGLCDWARRRDRDDWR